MYTTEDLVLTGVQLRPNSPSPIENSGVFISQRSRATVQQTRMCPETYTGNIPHGSTVCGQFHGDLLRDDITATTLRGYGPSGPFSADMATCELLARIVGLQRHEPVT
jgi:hypothetical protein